MYQPITHAVASILMFLSIASAQLPEQAGSNPNNATNSNELAGDIYKKASPAVVLIETYDEKGEVNAAGSGFLIRPNGYILTNYHVIAHTKKATVRLANKDAYDAVDVLEIDKRKDIALIKIRAVDLPVLSLGKSGQVNIGDQVFSVSNPLGVLQNTLSNGIVSGVRPLEGYRVFQITAPISHGSSGGPILDTSGQVVGISAMTIEEGQNLNFAIPIDYAKGMIDGTHELKPIAEIYEPPAPETPPAAEAKPTGTSAKTAGIPEYARQEVKDKGIFPWLEGKLLTWTPQDAEAALGAPHGRRMGIGNPAPDILAYADPTNSYREIEIAFGGANGKAQNIFVYPFRGTWADCKKIWGDKVFVKKLPNGNRYYGYKDRRLGVLIDAAGNVINVGVYAP